jgi:hypothetical protein
MESPPDVRCVLAGHIRCWLSLTMAQTAKKIVEIEISPHGKTDGAEALDLAIKSLLDGLVVPHLVEEFLRLYGPAAVAKTDEENMKSQPDSELNSTT